MTMLIGLKGRMHSGKDTAYDHLRDSNPDLAVRRVSFADKMKLSGVRSLGFTSKTGDEAIAIANYLKERCTIEIYAGRHCIKSITGREYWQFVGTEGHRDVFGTDFWVDVVLPRPSEHPDRDSRQIDNQQAVERSFPGADIVAFTDVRFHNEAARILRLGGEVWNIDADERLGPLPSESHESEWPLQETHITRRVDNN
jgi:hypothetical protein